ncbi:MAG: tetratricopeptide repeat protein [Desulfuromonadaceae bacterium]|nr:tetratricopeptide repeat protein [Desulfuromonadaceae bacterium]MDD2856486.1 tetratricopeptide repeat protein [Desulfuromonadaceae bacterium]
MNCRPAAKYVQSGAVLAALITFAVFFSSTANQFVALDDFAYIINNPNISSFNLKTVFWCFSSFYEGNWHPLAMLSLAVDRSVWGLNPFGYHLTNICIHSCTTYLVYLLFIKLLQSPVYYQHTDNIENMAGTQCGLPLVIGSSVGSLFYAIHPLRVESVVWASERKDVLCLFFIVASLLMYVMNYTKCSSDSSGSSRHYLYFPCALFFAACAFLSKPAAVSLPVILILLDWFPLKRISDMQSFFKSFLEKWPFLVLSAISTVLTLMAQQIAMINAPDVNLASRLLVACKALLFYVVKTIMPTGLTAFYIHPGNVVYSRLFEYLMYLFVILIISATALWSVRSTRLWLALWLFYVITLLPMIGLIQVGGQWAADRYSYLPSLGISLLVAAGFARLVLETVMRKYFRLLWVSIFLAGLLLIVYAGQTVRQISVWKNTETLASRIIDESPHMSGTPYLARAIYRNETGRYEDALSDITEAMKISLRRGMKRTYATIAFEYTAILRNLGRYAEALNMMEWGLSMSVISPPDDVLRLQKELLRLNHIQDDGTLSSYR